MMDFELKMEKVEKKQVWISAGALAGSYFAGTGASSSKVRLIC